MCKFLSFSNNIILWITIIELFFFIFSHYVTVMEVTVVMWQLLISWQMTADLYQLGEKIQQFSNGPYLKLIHPHYLRSISHKMQIVCIMLEIDLINLKWILDNLVLFKIVYFFESSLKYFNVWPLDLYIKRYIIY